MFISSRYLNYTDLTRNWKDVFSALTVWGEGKRQNEKKEHGIVSLSSGRCQIKFLFQNTYCFGPK